MALSANSTNNRIEFFDFLRVVAAFSVVIIHVDAQSYYDTDVRGFSWQVLNFFDSVTRWAVPVFFMMSGAIFLSRQHSIKKIVCKYFFKIVTAFVFWSVLYVGIQVYRGERAGWNAIQQMIKGYYHMWYLSAIAMLYLMTPILKRITDSQSVVRYTLIVAFLIGVFIPQIVDTVALFSETYSGILSLMLGKIKDGIFTGGVFYFLFGWYLVNIDLSKKQRRVIYILGIAGLMYTILFSSIVSVWKGEAVNGFYGPYRVNNVLYGVAVFVFAKYNLSYEKVYGRVERIIKSISKNSFGIYLSHVMVIECLNKVGGGLILVWEIQ